MPSSTQVQLRRGTSTQVASMTPVVGEPVVNTTDKRVHIGDGSTAGGIPQATTKDVQNQVGTFSVAAGTANAITLTNSIPAVSLSNLSVKFKASAANTGATTVNVDALGVKDIYKISGSSAVPLTGGEIVSGGIYEINYDGTQFLLGAGGGASGGCVVRHQIFTSSGTYTPNANLVSAIVEVQGGGGGGGAGGTGGTPTGGTGGTSSFGSLLSATGGAGGTRGSIAHAAAGAGSLGDINISGQEGGASGYQYVAPTTMGQTGKGGDSFLGRGANPRGCAENTVGRAASGYGAGGSGGGATSATNQTGNGGAAGGYARKAFTAATIGASQTITVGGAGAGGTMSGSTQNGGAGTQGVVIVTEYCSA